jgi:hypothetical protein
MGLLDTLYRDCEGFLDLRAIKNKNVIKRFVRPTDIDGIKAFISDNEGFDLYFGVATRDGAGGKKENIVHIPALWIDIDFKNIQESYAIQVLEQFPLQPTCRVKSGGGLHCYWKLKEPVEKDDCEICEHIMRSLATLLNGDMACCDASRILRIPNTKNLKYKPPRDVVLVYQNGSEYSLFDFEPFALIPPKKTTALTIPSSRGHLDAIMSCSFMTHCRESSATLSEPLWYAMITQLMKEPGGVALCHELSKPHPKYKRSEVDNKILHGINSSGPITCEKIRQLGYDCGMSCDVRSPAGLVSLRDPWEFDLSGEEYVSNRSNVSNESIESNVSGCQQIGADRSTIGAQCQQMSAENTDQFHTGLTAAIREWVTNSAGSFTTADIDREFNLRSRKKKNVEKWKPDAPAPSA